MYSLIKEWRETANYIARKIRQGNYIDQTGRCLSMQEVKILRRCARQLKRRYEKRI